MSKIARMACAFMLGLMLVTAPSLGMAWEFQMAGFASYVQSNYFQRGTNGFFGPYDIDYSGAGTFAGLNGWLGPQVLNGQEMVTGSTAARSSFSTTLFPAVRINQAVSLRGVYRIGNADTDLTPGATNVFAPGEWLQWWASLNTPLGLI